MKRLLTFLSGVAVAALFLCASPAAQTSNEVYENACGSVGDALVVLQQFFEGRWNARRAQLDDVAAHNYLVHHDIEEDYSVYVFQSRFFKDFAVVVARPVDKVMCIVKIDGRLHKEYSPDELHKILSTEKAI